MRRLIEREDCTCIHARDLSLVRAGASVESAASLPGNDAAVIDIFQAASDEDLRQVRTLLIEYQADIGVDLCFQQFDAELVGLPGSYAPPRGRLLLAVRDATIVGCVAMQPVSDMRCEMKRLYVRVPARHLGIGRQLVLRTLEEARQIGYEDIVLDTLPSMTRAQALYERLGFLDVPAYRPNPVPGVRYLGRRLA